MNSSIITHCTPGKNLENSNPQLNKTSHINKYGDKEALKLDLPEIVVILETLGFRIWSINGCSPAEVTSIRGDQRGVRVVVTCGHSGQRCILEQILEPQHCSCTKIPEDYQGDVSWEITATAPGNNKVSSKQFTETRLIPSIGKDLRGLIRDSFRFITKRIRDTMDQNQNKVSPPDRKNGKEDSSFHSPSDSAPLATSSAVDIRSNSRLTASPQKFNSPARYRSLDALTSKSIDPEIPAPGALTKETPPRRNVEVVAQSSPNIKLAIEEDNKQNQHLSLFEKSKEFEEVVKMLRESSNLLNKAIDIIESRRISVPKSPVVTENSGKTKNIKKFFETTLQRRANSKSRKEFKSSPAVSEGSGSRKDQTRTLKPQALLKKSSKTTANFNQVVSKIDSGLRGSASKISETKTPSNTQKLRSASSSSISKSGIPKPNSVRKNN